MCSAWNKIHAQQFAAARDETCRIVPVSEWRPPSDVLECWNAPRRCWWSRSVPWSSFCCSVTCWTALQKRQNRTVNHLFSSSWGMQVTHRAETSEPRANHEIYLLLCSWCSSKRQSFPSSAVKHPFRLQWQCTEKESNIHVRLSMNVSQAKTSGFQAELRRSNKFSGSVCYSEQSSL